MSNISTNRVVIKITEHAFKRLKERSGLNQSASNKTAHKAFEKGLSHSECTGNLHKWVLHTTQTSKKGSVFKIYGDKLWIFVKDKDNKNEITLVTVMQIPSNLKDLVNTLMQKKKENEL